MRYQTVLGKMMTAVFVLVLYVLTVSLSARGQIIGGMQNPSIDTPGEPFSYFMHPTDVIGTLFAPVASEVTPEGYIYTGFGELMFFVGNPPRPINQRIKTLEQGYLPVVQYRITDNNLTYRFTMFAADLGGSLEGVPVNFVRVDVKNKTSELRTGFLASAFRVQPPLTRLKLPLDFRFTQKFQLIPKGFTRGQVQFNPDWNYSFTNTSLVRDGSILYSFPQDPKPLQTSMTERDSGVEGAEHFLSGQIVLTKNSHFLLPSIPMGFVQYRLTLKPGEEKELIFKLPLAPVPESSPAAERLDTAHYDSQHQQQVKVWTELVGNHPPLNIPEDKVQHALLANTIYSLLAIDKVGDDDIPNVNKFNYHVYFPTDTALMAIALDDMGESSIVRKILLYGVKAEQPGGFFPRSSQLYERFGYMLWAWNRHYTLTRDGAFLADVYPSVQKAMNQEIDIATKDPLGLMPPSTVFDNARLKDCHQTGQDLWTLIGIRAAVQMAQTLGKNEDALRYQAEYRRFRKAFDKALALQTAKSGGYVPPSLDHTLAGNNWDNLHLLYPEPLFDLSDPRVTATDIRVRSTYQEGILPYIMPRARKVHNGVYTFDHSTRLHYFHSLDVAENELVQGQPSEQKDVVEDFYALLLHTTSTHATQEWGTYPWSTRSARAENILPDGDSSAVLVELARNMLVREYHDELHLFSAVSPEWLQPGKSIDIVHEPTNFGPVSASMRFTDNVLTINLPTKFRTAPSRIVVHIPWFYEATSAKLDGQSIAVHHSEITVPAGAKTLRLLGHMRKGEEPLSYAHAVEEYKAEYAKRYSEFLRTGKTTPGVRLDIETTHPKVN